MKSRWLRTCARLAVTLVAFVCPAPLAAAGWMHWPVSRGTSAGSYVTQGFYGDYITYCGARGNCGTHNGYDYGIGSGTPLYAVAPGVVDAVHDADSWSSAYGTAGKWVRVRHDGNTVSGLAGTYYVAFLHMSRIDVAVGQVVGTETVVGLSGATGGVAAHLHLHVSTSGTFCAGAVDPGCPTAPWVSGSVIPGFAGAPGCQGHCEAVSSMWVDPARYGGESYSGTSACGGLGFAGECSGETLRWCENGAIQTFDCAGSGQICGHQNASLGFNCMDCSELAEAGSPRCEGSRWLRCEAGQARVTDCAAQGQTCTAQGCVGGCEGLDFAGECAGDTLRWCENNAVQTYECPSTGQICGFQNAAIGFNCLDCNELAEGGSPRCEAGRWLQCAGGQAVATNCAAAGQSCGASGCEGGCAGLDYAGECVGDTLRWCEDGALREVDCLTTAEPQVCGYHNATIGFNCLTCAELAEGGSPRCEAGRWLRCEGAAPQASSCAAAGQSCEPSTGCAAQVEPEGCKDLDARGECVGSLSRRCESGVVVETDCAASSSNAHCAYDADQDTHRCIGCDELTEPRCDGATWLRCEQGTLTALDCAALGQLCSAQGCIEPPSLVDGGPTGSEPDASDADAGGDTAPPRDTSVGSDTGMEPEPEALGDLGETGCGCRAASTPVAPALAPWLAAALAGLLVLSCGRRRRRPESCHLGRDTRGGEHANGDAGSVGSVRRAGVGAVRLQWRRRG